MGKRSNALNLLPRIAGACALLALAPAAAQAPVPLKDLPAAEAAARADAKKRMGDSAGKLVVLDSKKVEWPDAALGCPKPGEAYGQMITPGYRIRIRAGTRVLDYHASEQGNLVLCPAKKDK